MSVAFYMDHHVHSAITHGLRRRVVDCMTCQEDGTEQLDDALLLARATALGRTVFTQDRDFLAIAAAHLNAGIGFAGIVYAQQLQLTIGEIIFDLELIAKTLEPEDMTDRIMWLPI